MNTPSQDRPLQGILWMLVTVGCFVVVNGIVRYLGTSLPAPQSAFIRFAWGVLFLLPFVKKVFELDIGVRGWSMFGLRTVLHIAAVCLWFYAMARLTMAEVTAIGYLNPIAVTLGAALLLGEGFAWRRMAAIVVAVIGALIVLRPGVREITSGHFAQLGAALCFGSSYLVAKQLTKLAPPSAVVAILTGSVTLGLAPLAYAVWEPVTLEQVLWLGGVAVFATCGHYTMTRAFAAAPMTVTQPVTFLQLVWATLLGALIFHEPVDPYVLLGGALIVGGISYMTWREAVLRRRITPVQPLTKV